MIRDALSPSFDESTTRSRRATRSSLARFSYGDAPNGDTNSDVAFGSDIEDAIKPSNTPSPPRNGTARKRKRTTTTTVAVKDESSGTTPLVIKKEEEDTEVKLESPAKPRRTRKPARVTTDADTGDAVVQAPSDWEEMYELVKEMRLYGPAANAAVDTMGCERLAGPEASAKDRRFHTLVALMLSSQTKDTVNAEAMKRLQAELPPCKEGAPPGLNLDNMLAVEPDLLNKLIWQVGFHNNKTKYALRACGSLYIYVFTDIGSTRYLKQAAEILRDKYNGDIPDTIEGLTSLPGVGPKMAHLCMSAENGWNRVEGIGVDVHVHRITNLWGWQQPPSKNPEETRHALQSWLPRDKWKEINWLLVGFGQSVCLPVGRKCGDCELGLRGLCKAAERKKVLEGRKRREQTVKVEVDGVVVKREEVMEEEVIRDVVTNEEVSQDDAGRSVNGR
jgi:endonuclease III